MFSKKNKPKYVLSGMKRSIYVKVQNQIYLRLLFFKTFIWSSSGRNMPFVQTLHGRM